MPILVAPAVPETPPGVPWPTRINEQPQVSFTDPAGLVTRFTDWENGWVLQPGAKGLDMPAYAFSQDESPGIDGYEIRQVRAQGKEIALPVAFWADDSRAAYLARRRGLIRSLNPKRGLGTLTVVQYDGSARTIGARYAAGLEGDESLDTAGTRWCMNVLSFACPSPFWLGAEASTQWQAAESGTFFPVLPLTVGTSHVLGSVTVDNDGDDTAFPVWTIEGPATSVTLTNVTTGETLVLTRTIIGGDTIVIDTRERRQTALLNDVTNLWNDISDASTMWALQPGINALTLTVAGSTSATRVRMTYQPRYLAA
ncbi:phage tail family protein [Streptomyces sp. LBUM 1486]|uniref:phage distal tail protein n=1 Tax=Streptomyces scabiei TaxID=1930 RepID=UPI001B333F1C|nr:phage tail domain-containing protein [Streptomyces sp. LBUM 1486]MBP5918673.1 phage tail family protein [Streptomyces sp. LBUM 1486]